MPGDDDDEAGVGVNWCCDSRWSGVRKGVGASKGDSFRRAPSATPAGFSLSSASSRFARDVKPRVARWVASGGGDRPPKGPSESDGGNRPSNSASECPVADASSPINIASVASGLIRVPVMICCTHGPSVGVGICDLRARSSPFCAAAAILACREASSNALMYWAQIRCLISLASAATICSRAELSC